MIDNFCIVLPYFNNEKMLRYQIKNWLSYPLKIKEKITIVIVDDASYFKKASSIIKEESNEDVLFNNIHVFRINENIPWNQDGARNLGMTNVKSICCQKHVFEKELDPICLLCDIDHVFPSSCIISLMDDIKNEKFDFKKEMFLIPRKRIRPCGKVEQLNVNKNIFLLSYSMFWSFGGYNEDVCGVYGTDNLSYDIICNSLKQRHMFLRTLIPDVYLIAFCEDNINDANTLGLDRSIFEKHTLIQLLEQKRKTRKEKDPNAQDILLLNFTWSKEI